MLWLSSCNKNVSPRVIAVCKFALADCGTSSLSNVKMTPSCPTTLLTYVHRARKVRWNVDEGAEAPLVGLVAAASSIGQGVVKSVQKYKARLRASRDASKNAPADNAASDAKIHRQSPQPDPAILERNITLEKVDTGIIYNTAHTMAARRYAVRAFENEAETAARRAKRGRALESAVSTASFAGDLIKVGLRGRLSSTSTPRTSEC